MSPEVPKTVSKPRPAKLAPSWHTATLVAVILAVAATGTLLAARGAPVPLPSKAGSRILLGYLPIVTVQGFLALYVCRIGRDRSAFASLLGRRWRTMGSFLGDAALGASAWLLLEASEIAWNALGGRGVAASVIALLPRTGLERIAWALVSISVGVSEELVYRGYLQVQLAACTRRVEGGLVLQAALFGVAHAEQGGAAAIRFAVYGVAFGALALWRRSLLPGMICHVGVDVASGLP